MTGKWIYAGAIALMALCTEQAAAQQEIVLHDVNGKKMKAALRKALPVEAPRVRYPGFKQETLVLKKGSIRREGTRPLPCDILMERDVPVKLRDGVTIYTDVFRPVSGEACPAILAWSPYGKEVGGQMLDDVPMRSGVAKSATSGLEKFEGPDPAYWVAHGYAVVNPDKRGAYMSEGNLLYWGTRMPWTDVTSSNGLPRRNGATDGGGVRTGECDAAFRFGQDYGAGGGIHLHAGRTACDKDAGGQRN